MAIILYYIFRYTSKVNHELSSTCIIGIFNSIQHTTIYSWKKWIHHPKINVLNIISVKIYIRSNCPRNTAPIFKRILQATISLQYRIKIVLTSFWRIVGQIQYRKICIDYLSLLFSEYLLWLNWPYIMILCIFFSNICRSGYTRATVKYIINYINI